MLFSAFAHTTAMCTYRKTEKKHNIFNTTFFICLGEKQQHAYYKLKTLGYARILISKQRITTAKSTQLQHTQSTGGWDPKIKTRKHTGDTSLIPNTNNTCLFSNWTYYLTDGVRITTISLYCAYFIY